MRKPPCDGPAVATCLLGCAEHDHRDPLVDRAVVQDRGTLGPPLPELAPGRREVG